MVVPEVESVTRVSPTYRTPRSVSHSTTGVRPNRTGYTWCGGAILSCHVWEQMHESQQVARISMALCHGSKAKSVFHMCQNFVVKKCSEKTSLIRLSFQTLFPVSKLTRGAPTHLSH